MSKTNKKIRWVTAVLAVVMIVSTVMTVHLSATGTTYYGSSPSISNTTGTLDLGTDKLYNESVMYKLPETVAADDDISIIVKMKSDSLLDAYDASGSKLSFGSYALSSEADAVRQSIQNDSNALKQKLEGIDYVSGESYNVIMSGFEIIIKACDFESVCKAVKGDATVIVGEVYEACDTQLVENRVNVYETGIFNSDAFQDQYGFDGTGILVAVLDTGIDYYHSAFLDKYYTADRNKLGLTFDEVAAYLAGNDMAAESMKDGLTAEDLYVSDKIPFAFDYADSDADVFPLLSNHGTHVSGVIAGNYLEHIESEDYTGEFVGVAPGAQIAAMKIFSDVEATSHTSWILAALEDCVTIGVDVINMSIGTTCGFSRPSDKEAISGVYDEIRDRGISLVVAASNSFNSGYSSDKNGNLPLTSNPDSATVGSPSTYLGALSVASIEGAKTPYLTYDGKIMYFTESTDRFSEEKDFVGELLGSSTEPRNIEYVLVAGAGRTAADYTGIDVKGKIALIKRGYNTFEEKVALAEEMGAAGVIIYNNVSGDIRMNVGETSLPVCSISQNDGELLAAAGTGYITISDKQISGPFISDFSSWGPTPDLKIKPEITAHGGSILSAVPGESYDRISGTSMATPNISGVTALLRHYTINRFGYDGDADAIEITNTVNRLMMSTADIILNTNGLPYSVRKQGAGLANLTDSAATNAYLITYDSDGSVMDKPKIELGDDPTKTGVYTLNFGIVNFGQSALSYDLSYYVLTEGVSETKTAQGETTVTEEAYELKGAKVEIISVTGGTLNEKTISVDGGKTAQVSVKITLSDSDKKYLNDSFENGMYVEGYITLSNADKAQSLNLPYLGFYGDWTEAPLFDIDFFETNADELDDSIDMLDKTLPDAYATRPIGGSTGDYVSYLGSYYFEQNPANKIIAADRKYISISNQTGNNEINSVRFVWAGLLRNAQRVEVTIVDDATGEIVYQTTDYDIRKSYGEGGPIRPGNIDIEFSAIEHNLKNNTRYTVTLKGYLDYGEDGGEDTNLSNEFVFPVVTDFSSPVLTDCEFYTEYDRSTKKNRLFAKMAVYDNHYAMALQAGYVGTDSTGNPIFYNFEKFATPVYSEFNSTTYVQYELTDYIDDIVSGSYNNNTFTIACYDYAMNSSTFEIALPTDFEAFYFEESEITLSPNEVYNLSPIVYPADQWGETITYDVNVAGSKVVSVVNNQIIAKQSGGAIITARTSDGKTFKLQVKVLAKGEPGYKTYSKPVASSFSLSGYYVNKAFYILDNTQRDIGTTDTEMKFAYAGNYSLSMYPSESVTLRYELDAYFPETTEVVFSSGNESIVTVDASGKITAVSEGLASITAKVMMDGKSTLYSATVSINVKEPFITSGPTLSNYYGAGDSANHVTFPSTLAITEIGQFAFSNYDYVDKGPDDEISDESPETMKMWYLGDNTIRQVTIPEGVTRIGPYAFANMTALEKVTLPSTLETIDYGAFIGCTKLTTVVGIEHVKFINRAAFQGCALTGTVNLGNAVAIADYAFSENAAIREVKLPATLQSLGSYAFGANSSLKNVTIAAEKIKLGQYAFTNCTSLESISINSAVVPEGAFNECTSLSSVTLGKDVAVVGEYAFRNTAVTKFALADGNTAFKSINNGEYLTNMAGTEILLVSPKATGLTVSNANITSIGVGAFSHCSGIVSVEIPSVTAVGDYAFSECTKLGAVNLGDLTSIGAYAFENTALDTFEFRGDVTIGEYAFSGSKISSITVGDGLTVPRGTFANCSKLETVIIGNGVVIGEYAFYNNDYHAESYTVTEDKTRAVYYVVFDGPIKNLTIGKNADIGEGAFYGAANLVHVDLGDGAKIGDFAFYNTAKLESIDLSKAVSIGESAFSGDIHYEYATENYTEVYITGDGEYKFRYYSPVFTSVDLSAADAVGKNAFANCRELATVTLGDGVTEIGEAAFQYCEKLTTVNLDKVVTVRDYAFAECDLRQVNLASATEIGDYAFCYNEGLLSVTIGADDANIGEGAFSYCEALAELVGEEKAIYIGDYAFAGTAIVSADLSAAEYIGTYAFYKDEPTVFTVVLTEAVSDMGDNPFANCIIAPLSTTVTETFLDQEYTKTVYTFDLSETIKIIDGSIYRVVPKGLELIIWTGDERAVVADDTVRISAMAFAGQDVKQVILPYTVASIGHKAFYGCNKLQFVSFASYQAPILEEEYDSTYFESMEHIPAKGTYYFEDYNGGSIEIEGKAIVPYFMWNVTSLPGNFFYGASFVDYVGNVDNKITMIRPSNGKCYDSFIMNQYFNLTVDGASAPDDITLAAIDAIMGLPEDAKQITLAHKAQVAAARAAYNKIASDEQRALVSGDVLARLTTAEQRIADLEYMSSSKDEDVTPEPEKKSNLHLILNIIIGSVFILVVAAFVVVLIIFIKMIKSGAPLPFGPKTPKLTVPEARPDAEAAVSEDTAEAADKPAASKTYYETVEPYKCKMEKKPINRADSIEKVLARHREGGMSKKNQLIIIICSAVAAVLLIAGLIWALTREEDSFVSSFGDEGYTVSVTFDSNGGTFKGSDSNVVDLYRPEDIGSGGIKLLAPDDPRRDKSNALTVTKAEHFLAGWYTTRELIDENNPDAGYKYSGKWDFETNTVRIDPDKEYSADESVLTLYAAWVPYYNYEIYAEENGEMKLISSVSALNLTIPSWGDTDVTLDMDNFPVREGFTLDEVFYDEAMTDPVVGAPIGSGTKNVISGEWDEETATSLTPTIKLYTTWQEGERYRIYSVEDLRKNANSTGYYEIYANLDFTGYEWPTAFANNKFSGKIYGNGYKIKNVSIESNSRSRINNGLFSSLDETAYIENITFENVTHTINLQDVGQDAKFGLIAGAVSEGASFNNVKLGGKLLIGDDCAYISADSVYTISKIAGSGKTDGITASVTVEKANPDNTSLTIEVEDDGTVSIITGNQ